VRHCLAFVKLDWYNKRCQVSVVGVSTEPVIGPKWLIPPGVVRAQWFVTRSLQKTLVGLASALMVAGVAPV
jgi:hypothetical protein